LNTSIFNYSSLHILKQRWVPIHPLQPFQIQN